jgi:mono/diheme cytochrome c family protein
MIRVFSHVKARFGGLLLVPACLMVSANVWGQHVTARPYASTPRDSAYFRQAVQPILEKRCLGCHGVGARLSGLDLRSREAALHGGTRGAAFVAGNASKSVLYQMISGVRTPQMPPTARLSPSAIAVLKKWLDGGAPYADTPVNSAQKQLWWSFKPPVRPHVPAFQPVEVAKLHTSSVAASKSRSAFSPSAWIRSPVDAFVLQKLRASGLTPSPCASKITLIRRAYMDLIGIPPSPEEVQAFLADRSPTAYEKLVDRLLASPSYGERWGRHWLDVVRYADSGGFEGDRDRPYAWRYRDYVIAAFNTDKPFDQFVREQLAGDEVAPDSPEALVATGYLAVGPQDIVMQNAKNRADELDDLVSTTGAAFLGLTTGCARCHDHKYDPIKQTDYYRLQAIFAPTERRDIDLPTAAERKHYDELTAEMTPVQQNLDALRSGALKNLVAKGVAKPTDPQIVAALSEAARKQWDALQAQVRDLTAARGELPRAQIVTDQGKAFPVSHVMIRGVADKLGDEVKPGFICALPGGAADIGTAEATDKTTGRRRALAEWLANRNNPLTARVFLNRVWRQHFGRGIVNTPSNFGVSGEIPSHPELLDWLAVTFMENGWHLKPIQRMIVLSSTYRQASVLREDANRADPQNRLIWRMPLKRLEGESVRDSVLCVSGALNRQMGGPPVYPPVDPSLRADTFQGPNWKDGEDGPMTWRRSVYVKVKRSLLLPELEVFDCPEITYTVAARNISTTPLQALTLQNAPFVLHQSDLFAARVAKEAGREPGRQVDRAYRLALCRPPTARERALSLAYLQKRGASALQDFCHALFNLNEFVYVP